LAKAGIVLRSTRNRRVDAIFPSAWTTTRLPMANDAGHRGRRPVGGRLLRPPLSPRSANAGACDLAR